MSATPKLKRNIVNQQNKTICRLSKLGYIPKKVRLANNIKKVTKYIINSRKERAMITSMCFIERYINKPWLALTAPSDLMAIR